MSEKRPRLRTNVIHNLEDMFAVFLRVWPEVAAISERAEKQMDPVMLARLNKLSQKLARIERKARDARQNVYDPRS
jgi:hypothetical protein